MALKDYTKLKGVNEVGDSLFMSTLENNLKVFFDWGLLGIGAWFDVQIPQSGVYGGFYHKLRRVDDPSYDAGQVWETPRQDLVWETGVSYPSGLSTVQPVQISGVYGATKFLMEKLFSEFEDLNPKTNYRIVRLGNVVYSVDSVLYKWKNLIQNGKELIITDPNATRFWISVNESINIIIECLQQSNDSTPYYKPMKSSTMGNLLKAMILKYSPKNKKSPIKTIGLQPGENQHERISNDSPPSYAATQYNIKELIELI